MRLALLAALSAALLLPITPTSARADAGDAEAAGRAIHLLDYLAVDYPATVRDGAVVNDLEYAEQLEFAGQIRERLAGLGVADDDPLARDAEALASAVRSRAPGAAITARARALAGDLRERFAVRALPREAPSPAAGRALYAQDCAGCHGAEGRGDGPAGASLEPRPANLTNPVRMRALSPFALYSTITYGIEGTAMAPFAASLSEAQRWDLAFYVATLASSPAEVTRGRELAQAEPARVAERVDGLDALVSRAPATIAGDDPDDAALVAYLLAHPEALQGRELPLAIARERLAGSWEAYRSGETGRAVDLAVSAYLDGFEHVEPALGSLDSGLRRQIESEFLRYREALRAGRPADEVEPLHRELLAGLARAEALLAGGGMGPTATFLASLTILAREGLEAVLLIVALLGVVVRAGRRDALPWVHAGWISALVAGAATWWAAGRIIDISGANREVVEGVSALLAAAILFYVSYWLVSRIQAARWQAFIDGRIRGALSGGRLGALAAVSFVAAYRECFETVLFYQALAVQAGPDGGHAVLAGIGAGAGLLAVVAATIFRFGLRLPLRRFFAGSSVLLYALAVVLAGHGVAALQEAAWLPVTLVPFVRIEWLGIHPTLEGLAVQGTLLVAALAAFVKLSLRQRETRTGLAGSPREG